MTSEDDRFRPTLILFSPWDISAGWRKSRRNITGSAWNAAAPHWMAGVQSVML